MTSIIFIDTPCWPDSSIDRASDFHSCDRRSNPGPGVHTNFFFFGFFSVPKPINFWSMVYKRCHFASKMQNAIFCTPSTKNICGVGGVLPRTVRFRVSAYYDNLHRSRRSIIRQGEGGGRLGTHLGEPNPYLCHSWLQGGFYHIVDINTCQKL